MVAPVQSSHQATRYEFADLTIDVGLRQVTREGQALHLGRLTYEMLLALVEAAPNVVMHDQLAERVWEGRTATPETVAQRVKLLRHALDDDTSHPRYIEVSRGQGYRLIPPVERSTAIPSIAIGEHAAAAAAAPQDSRKLPRPRIWMAAAVVLIAASTAALVWFARNQEAEDTPPVQAAIKSIAVLPFADMSEDQNQQFIADGVAEEILDRLAQNKGSLRVIARTSSFSFRDPNARIPEIAQKLNVSHILEGSVRKSGDRVRITVQLIEGAGATHVWSETYDRKLGELFDVQSEIASAVAATLQVALADSSSGNSKSISVESQEDFLQAKFFYGRRAPDDIERSIKYLEAAVARDPDFALGWAMLSGAYGLMWRDLDLDPAIWRKRQGEAARRAVEADPELLEARNRLGQYYIDVSDRKNAIEQFREAARHDPENPWLASYARGVLPWHIRDVEQELHEGREEIQNDPFSPIARTNYGLKLFGAGHLDEALAEFQRALELNPDAHWNTRLEIARVLVAQKHYDEARAASYRLPAEARDYGVALLHDAPGQRTASDAALARLTTRPGDFMHGIRLAEALVLRGKNEESFAMLRRARDQIPRDESILSRLWQFQNELKLAYFLQPLHGDERWSGLLEIPEGDSAQEIIERLWPDARSASLLQVKS